MRVKNVVPIYNQWHNFSNKLKRKIEILNLHMYFNTIIKKYKNRLTSSGSAAVSRGNNNNNIYNRAYN